MAQHPSVPARVVHTITEPERQLELIGLEHARRIADSATATPAVRARMMRRVESAHELLSESPTSEDIAFSHAGLCQTFLPHRRPRENHTPWQSLASVAQEAEAGEAWILVRR
jgi:hypothetical protein